MGNSSSSSSIPSSPDKINNDDDEVMGNSSSSASSIPNSPDKSNTDNSDDKVICIDCDKKNQKDLPKDDPLLQKDQPCASFYEAVCACNTKYDGQISSCTKEWDAFRKCHTDGQEQKQRARN